MPVLPHGVRGDQYRSLSPSVSTYVTNALFENLLISFFYFLCMKSWLCNPLKLTEPNLGGVDFHMPKQDYTQKARIGPKFIFSNFIEIFR